MKAGLRRHKGSVQELMGLPKHTISRSSCSEGYYTLAGGNSCSAHTQSICLGCDLAVASLAALVTVVVTAGGGFASYRWCGESGTPIMPSAAAGRSPAVAIAVLHAVKGHACFSNVDEMEHLSCLKAKI